MRRPASRSRREEIIEGKRLARETERENSQNGLAEVQKTWINGWARKKWEREWAAYAESRSNEVHPGLKLLKRKAHLGIHKTLRKAESSLLTQIRTGRIGLNKFLHKRKVPDVTSPLCPCGKDEQDVRHLLKCERYKTEVADLKRQTGTTDLDELLQSVKGSKAVVRWLMRLGILKQYSLAVKELEEGEWNEREGEG